MSDLRPGRFKLEAGWVLGLERYRQMHKPIISDAGMEAAVMSRRDNRCLLSII